MSHLYDLFHRLKGEQNIEPVDIDCRCYNGTIEYHYGDGTLLVTFDEPYPYYACIQKSDKYTVMDEMGNILTGKTRKFIQALESLF